jgi:O-antigen/teichoic acid export membrane protein
VALQLLARVSGLPMSVVTLGITTRYLGEQGYGLLTTAVVFVGLFDVFTELGVGTVIVRRVAGRDEDAMPRLVGMNLAFSAGYALPLALLCAGAGIVVYAGRPTVWLAVLIVSSQLIFDSLSSCLSPVFDLGVRYSGVALAEVGSRALTLVAVTLVALTHAGLLAMCVVQVLPPLLNLIISVFAARRLVPLRFVLARAETLKLLRESLPFATIIVIAVVYWRADGVLLSLLSNAAQVACYGIALQLAFNLTVLPQVFSRSAQSTINEGYSTDPPRFVAAVDSGYRFLLLCAAPIAVLGIPLAGRIIAVVNSSEFAGQATPVLRLFFVAVAVSFLTGISSSALVAAHEQRFLTTLSAVNLAVNIGLNLLLIPHLGATGTGVSLVVTEVSGVVFTQFRLRRVGVGAFPFGYLLRLTPGLALALVALWATWSLPFVVPLVLAGVGYVVGALLGGGIPAEMRATLLGAVRRRSSRQETPPTPTGPAGEKP